MDTVFPRGGFPGTCRTTAASASEGTVFWCRSITGRREGKLAPSRWGCSSKAWCWGWARGEEKDQQPFSFLSHCPILHCISVFPQDGSQLMLSSHCPGERCSPPAPSSPNCSVWKVSRNPWPPRVVAVVSTSVLGCYSCYSECQLINILNHSTQQEPSRLEPRVTRCRRAFSKQTIAR